MGHRFLSFQVPEVTLFVLWRGQVFSVYAESKPVSPRAHRKEWDGRKHRNVVEAVGFLLKECVFKLSFSGIFFFFIDV